MANTVGDFLLEQLGQWGVKRHVRLSRRRHQRGGLAGGSSVER